MELSKENLGNVQHRKNFTKKCNTKITNSAKTITKAIVCNAQCSSVTGCSSNSSVLGGTSRSLLPGEFHNSRRQ